MNRREARRLGFAAAGVSLYTLGYALKGHLITANLSQIGNRPGNRGGFILWGVLCAGVFFLMFTRAFAMARYDGAVGKGLLAAACGSFLACVLIPFLPEKYPKCARWHNDLAMLAALLVAVELLVFMQHVRRRVDRRFGSQMLLLWGMSMALCLWLMRKTGISGLLEVAFIGVSVYLLFRMMLGLRALDGQSAAESSIAEEALAMAEQ